MSEDEKGHLKVWLCRKCKTGRLWPYGADSFQCGHCTTKYLAHAGTEASAASINGSHALKTGAAFMRLVENLRNEGIISPAIYGEVAEILQR